MAKQGVHGRIVFVGSTLGYMSFIGWAGYSPGKHALVGTYPCFSPIIFAIRTYSYDLFQSVQTSYTFLWNRRLSPNPLPGLAETLRSELALYHIDVQIYQSGTMYTPGFENENKTKPAITRKIEEGGDGMTPEQAAAAMLKGQYSTA